MEFLVLGGLKRTINSMKNEQLRRRKHIPEPIKFEMNYPLRIKELFEDYRAVRIMMMAARMDVKGYEKRIEDLISCLTKDLKLRE